MSYRTRLSFGELTHENILAALSAGERRLYWIALANFLSFLVLWFIVGGNVLNGGIEDGRYFVTSGRSRTEVSGFVFGYSVAHTLSLLITHPMGMLIGFRGRRRVLNERNR